MQLQQLHSFPLTLQKMAQKHFSWIVCRRAGLPLQNWHHESEWFFAHSATNVGWRNSCIILFYTNHKFLFLTCRQNWLRYRSLFWTRKNLLQHSFYKILAVWDMNKNRIVYTMRCELMTRMKAEAIQTHELRTLACWWFFDIRRRNTFKCGSLSAKVGTFHLGC